MQYISVNPLVFVNKMFNTYHASNELGEGHSGAVVEDGGILVDGKDKTARCLVAVGIRSDLRE